jgi:uncharacterized protein YbjT (DUF2867 family)
MLVVAGATGRTGGAAAESLLAAASPLRVIVREPAKAESWRMRGAEVAIAALDDREALARALAGAKGLYTLLPEPPIAQFNAQRRLMADAMGAAVAQAALPHVVFLSTTAAFLADGNGPASDLHYAETVLRAAASKLTVIRASYLQENLLTALPAARNDGIYPNFLPSADTPFPTVATVDIGRLAAQCLLEPPAASEVIDLLGPAYSVRQMAAELGRALGRELGIVDIPGAAHVPTLLGAGLPRDYAEAVAEMFACLASGRVAPHGHRVLFAETRLDQTIARYLNA